MSESKQIRILIVDDHPLVRAGVAAVIANEPDMAVIGEVPTAVEAIRRFRDIVPDVTLMDLRLPDMSGIEAAIAIRQEFPRARVIILSVSDGDVEIQRALRAGVHSYLLKSMPPGEIIVAIRKVHSGKKIIPPEVATNLAQHVTDDPLTGREIEVLRQIAAGRRNRTIDDDFVPLLFAHGKFNSRLTSYQEDRNRMIPGVVEVQKYENVVELGYGIQVAPWLKLRPNLQYVIHPGGTGSIPNALVIGLFSCVTF